MGIYAIDKIIHYPNRARRAEQVVPNRKYIAIIAICMRLDIMMVDLMKMGCNKDPR